MTGTNLCVNQSNLPAATVVAKSEDWHKNDYETAPHHWAYGNADNLCLHEVVWCSATLAIHVVTLTKKQNDEIAWPKS